MGYFEFDGSITTHKFTVHRASDAQKCKLKLYRWKQKSYLSSALMNQNVKHPPD